MQNNLLPNYWGAVAERLKGKTYQQVTMLFFFPNGKAVFENRLPFRALRAHPPNNWEGESCVPLDLSPFVG